jgi:serine/threonine-protein kinase
MVGAALLAAVPSVALAQDGASKEAEALFRDARKAMDAQDFLAAKEKLELSQRIIPGPGTLLNLGFCYERLGLLANAYRSYRAAVLLSQKLKRPERAQAANGKLNELRKKLGLATIVVNQANTTATIDGVVVEGTEKVPLEEGRHVLKATAPGFVPWSTELRAEKGEKIRVIVPPLVSESAPKSAGAPPPPAQAKVTVEPDDAPPAPVAAVPPPSNHSPASAAASASSPGAASAVAPPPAPESPTTSSPLLTQRNVGLAVAGVGVVGIGVGVVLGLGAKSTYDEIGPHCNDRVCDKEGVDITSRAKTSATWATIATAAGGAAVAGGLVLFFMAPRAKNAPPRVGASLGPDGPRFTFSEAF